MTATDILWIIVSPLLTFLYFYISVQIFNKFSSFGGWLVKIKKYKALKLLYFLCLPLTIITLILEEIFNK